MTKTIKATIGYDGQTQDVQFSVPDTEPPYWDRNHQFTVVGKERLKRPDALDKVTGKAKYTHDINRPNMLYAVMVTSPHANAAITNIDIAEAQKMPGVKSIKTVSSKSPAYAGALVAGVAAETIQQARDAAQKVKVTYDVKTFRTGEDESFITKRVSYVDPKTVSEGTLLSAVPMNRGNVANGFAQADEVLENRYETQVTPHCTLETHGCVAEWTDGNLTLWYSVQGIWAARQDSAGAAGVATNKIRVIAQHVGGAFGSKLQTEDFGGMCIQMAKETGRPVKFMANRYEDIVKCGNKPGLRAMVKIGGKKDGTLTAISCSGQYLVGSSGGESVSGPFHNNYDCPNINVSDSALTFNAGASRAFRAPGYPQATFCLEMAVEEMAFKLGVDPLDLRIKNIKPGILDARAYELQVGGEKIGWKDKFKPHGSGTGIIKHGIGCAVTTWPYYANGAGAAAVRCTINPDGKVEVANGSQDMGTGNRTAILAVAAESLGISPDLITVVIGDTQLGLNGPQSGGSVTTHGVAPATYSATYLAKRKIFALVAEQWQTTVDDIECQNGVVFSFSDASKKMNWADATKLSTTPVTATGQNRNSQSVSGITTGTNMRGAQFAEVEVNTETGRVNIVKIVAVQDCGKAMARAQAENQIRGGVILGIGFALYEDRILDNIKGRPINASMETYKLPGVFEIPEIEPVLIDVFDPVNSTSAKGLGEPPHIPTAAAIGCAVFNAIGVPVRSLPITPYKILKALGKVEG